MTALVHAKLLIYDMFIISWILISFQSCISRFVSIYVTLCVYKKVLYLIRPYESLLSPSLCIYSRKVCMIAECIGWYNNVTYDPVKSLSGLCQSLGHYGSVDMSTI